MSQVVLEFMFQGPSIWYVESQLSPLPMWYVESQLSPLPMWCYIEIWYCFAIISDLKEKKTERSSINLVKYMVIYICFAIVLDFDFMFGDISWG